ncbi:MAG: YggS family pyridoxal phosphate-dependent enzyme, partial [Bacteroidota bacterium]
MIAANIAALQKELENTGCRLIAVSKTQPLEKLREAYDAGQRIFGENKAQEMTLKHEQLPSDIEWHMIGHLQRNKVKYIAPYVSLIHSVDSMRLLEEIDRNGEKINRVIPCLLQVHIATEETKFGFDEAELIGAIAAIGTMKFVTVNGLMGMATFTDNNDQVRSEFHRLKMLFDKLKNMSLPD